MAAGKWRDLGSVSVIKKRSLNQFEIDGVRIALVHKNGEFSAVSGVCNHMKGPLGRGRLEGDYIVCPWHAWHFHRKSGHGHHPFEASHLPIYALREKKGRLYINLRPLTKRAEYPHPPHPLSRPVKREKGPIRVLGISTTAVDKIMSRHSASEHLLDAALKHAAGPLKCETKLIKVRDMKFKHCGGFYSIDEHACTWPCTYTQSDEKDELAKLYEALVFWADVVLVASPIRWGNASSLYYKMAERLNCIENQLLIKDTALLKNKTAGFIIIGGQDNVQSVAGNMLSFFSQIGFVFPQFPVVGHSRGWAAEDMDNNNEFIKKSGKLKKEVRLLIERCVAFARTLVV